MLLNDVQEKNVLRCKDPSDCAGEYPSSRDFEGIVIRLAEHFETTCLLSLFCGHSRVLSALYSKVGLAALSLAAETFLCELSQAAFNKAEKGPGNREPFCVKHVEAVSASPSWMAPYARSADAEASSAPSRKRRAVTTVRGKLGALKSAYGERLT